VNLDLGPRTEREILRSQLREVEQERVAAIDRRLIRSIDAEGLVDPRRGSWVEQDLRRARLRTLSGMGLASEQRDGRWRLDPELETTLREMGRRGDIVRTMNHPFRYRCSRGRRRISRSTIRIRPMRGRWSAGLSRPAWRRSMQIGGSSSSMGSMAAPTMWTWGLACRIRGRGRSSGLSPGRRAFGRWIGRSRRSPAPARGGTASSFISSGTLRRASRSPRRISASWRRFAAAAFLSSGRSMATGRSLRITWSGLRRTSGGFALGCR
jgi:hypothetical protein